MRTLVRRGLIVLGFSTLVGVVFVPLGDSGWAEGIRAEQAEQPGGTPEKEAGPPLALRVIAPVVKETLLMGIPAGLVVLLAMGIRRLTR